MKKLDFITIIYNDEREINLLKLQASSFSFVDTNIINNINLSNYDYLYSALHRSAHFATSICARFHNDLYSNIVGYLYY